MSKGITIHPLGTIKVGNRAAVRYLLITFKNVKAESSKKKSVFKCFICATINNIQGLLFEGKKKSFPF